MKIYTKIVIDFDGNVLEQHGYDYDGPVSECKGATAEQKDQAAAQAGLAKKQAAFYDVMTSSYNKMFAGQTAILDSLQKAFAPILAKGPSQFGFSKAEESALRTQASESTAANYDMAKKAVAEGQAAVSGDSFIPKGSDAQIRAQLASKAAEVESQEQLGITAAGFNQGRANFAQAAGALGGVASIQNPLGYSGASTGAGGAATGANEAAFRDYTTIYEENKADSPWNMVGGLLGGALGAGLNAFTGGLAGPLGGAVAKKMGGSSGVSYGERG